MLLFSTILKLKETVSKDDFINLVIEWNETNTTYMENYVPNVVLRDTREGKFGNEKVSLEFREYRRKNIIAVRYKKAQDNGSLWTTEYVANFDEHRVAIRLERDFSKESLFVSKDFSTPKFIELLIHKGYLEMDNRLAITDSARAVQNNELPALAKIVRREKRYDLPAVYVSHRFNGELPLDIAELSYRLKGVAHVLYLDDQTDSMELGRRTDKTAEFNGYIGIYYPKLSVNKTCLCNANIYDPDGPRKLLENTVRSVIGYCNTQALPAYYTFSEITNSIALDQLQSAQAKKELAEKEKADTEDSAQDILLNASELEKELTEMKRELFNARAEAEGWRALWNENAAASGNPIIVSGTEKEVYKDEIKDMILGILQNELQSRTKEGSRKEIIIKELLEVNGGFQDLTSKWLDEIEKVFLNSRNFTKSSENAMRKLGFEVYFGGKHPHLLLNDDSRFERPCSCTSSSVFMPVNAKAEMKRDLFLDTTSK